MILAPPRKVPHKTPRGAAALKRLELYEGVPPAQDKVKKMVVPAALRVLRLKPGRKVGYLLCVASQLNSKVVLYLETNLGGSRLGIQGCCRQVGGKEEGQGEGLLRAQGGCQLTGLLEERVEADELALLVASCAQAASKGGRYCPSG